MNLDNYRIIKDPSKEFLLLVQYKSEMPQLFGKWEGENHQYDYARCHTQASADKRYAAMIKDKENIK